MTLELVPDVSLQQAADRVLTELGQGAGGLIAVAADGSFVMPFNTGLLIIASK